jgi:tRNA pseudouridine55 synthase
MGERKVYEARVVFGTATDTDDAEGKIVAQAPVPEQIGDRAYALELLQSFRGEQAQVPPRVSAIKKDGVAAYRRVRRGEEFVVAPRLVTVHVLDLLGLGVDASGAVWWDVRAEVSKGTYLRSLARDLGEAAGTRAHLGALRRTRIGSVDVEEAHTLQELEQMDDISVCFR